MHWLGLAKPDSEYFGGQDLPNLESKITVTIKAYNIEVIRTQKGETKKGVLHFFENVKPWIVSKEKLMPIKNQYGLETDKWIGKKITLYFDPTIKFGREVTGGVRAEIPTETQQHYICLKCGAEIKAMGKYTAAYLATKTKKSYGAELCSDCALKAAEAAKNAE